MNKKVVPVSPGKKKPPSGRVYSTYDQKYQKDPAYMNKQVTRNRDRRKAQEEGRVKKGSGKDVHHVNGAAKGGPTRIIEASKHRGMK
jgi:hypothetical protein